MKHLLPLAVFAAIVALGIFLLSLWAEQEKERYLGLPVPGDKR